MAEPMLSNMPTKYNGSLTDSNKKACFSSDSFSRSWDLVSIKRISKSNDALCLVKDVLPDRVMNLPASKLRIYANGKSTFLFTLAGGQ